MDTYIDATPGAFAGARLVHVGARAAREATVLEEHQHDGVWQADWVLSGHVEYNVPSDSFRVGSREICFIKSGIPHQLRTSQGLVIRAIKFELSFDPFERQGTHGVRVVRISESERLLGALAEEVFAPRDTLPWRMSPGYLGALLLLMSPLAATWSDGDGVKDDLIARVQRYVAGRLGQGVSVTDMAHEAHLSVPYFSRRFRAAVGMSPGQWLTQQRLVQGAELMLYSDLTITEAAHAVGYSDLPTFSKAFSRWKGISPSAYRARWRNSTSPFSVEQAGPRSRA